MPSMPQTLSPVQPAGTAKGASKPAVNTVPTAAKYFKIKMGRDVSTSPDSPITERYFTFEWTCHPDVRE
jgi:hypothetical protein